MAPSKIETIANEPKMGDQAAIKELVQTVRKLHAMPLWEQMTKLNPPAPNPTAVPHVWRYKDIRPSLGQAGELVGEKQAERRVLMLVNPARGMYLRHRSPILAYAIGV